MERAKKPEKLPTVMSKKEVGQVLAEISGTHRLMAKLLYGCGLGLMERVRIQVRDVDCDQDQIIVRGGKGMKDRSTLLPEQPKKLLSDQWERVKILLEKDLKNGWDEDEIVERFERIFDVKRCQKPKPVLAKMWQ